ncbi:MAG: hypothetical protein LC734_01355 [Acidobacteria bacterium]|nr:hypothetical protein [Acidobacteriota bacterium]
MLLKTLFLLTLAFPLAAFAQTDLPEYGKLTDLPENPVVYLIAELTENREGMKRVLSRHSLFATFADDPETANLFIEYISVRNQNSFLLAIESGELRVFTRANGRRRLLWTASSSGAAYKATQPKKLAKRFLSELKKTHR